MHFCSGQWAVDMISQRVTLYELPARHLSHLALQVAASFPYFLLHPATAWAFVVHVPQDIRHTSYDASQSLLHWPAPLLWASTIVGWENSCDDDIFKPPASAAFIGANSTAAKIVAAMKRPAAKVDRYDFMVFLFSCA